MLTPFYFLHLPDHPIKSLRYQPHCQPLRQIFAAHLEVLPWTFSFIRLLVKYFYLPPLHFSQQFISCCVLTVRFVIEDRVLQLLVYKRLLLNAYAVSRVIYRVCHKLCTHTAKDFNSFMPWVILLYLANLKGFLLFKV